MTLFSPDAKLFISHYRLVWKPTFVLPFGLEAKLNFRSYLIPFGLGPNFILPSPAAAEENLGFTVGIFRFLTEKVNFILPFGLEANFHITVWSGVRILYY
jgi:hypothetical protein